MLLVRMFLARVRFGLGWFITYTDWGGRVLLCMWHELCAFRAVSPSRILWWLVHHYSSDQVLALCVGRGVSGSGWVALRDVFLLEELRLGVGHATIIRSGPDKAALLSMCAAAADRMMPFHRRKIANDGMVE